MLAKHSQTEILGCDKIQESDILANQIGVGLFSKLQHSSFYAMAGLLILSLSQVSMAGILLSYGHVYPGSFVLTMCSTLFMSMVALLLTCLQSRTLRSAELSLAVDKLDQFVQDCGQGLDWSTVAKLEYRFALALWAVAGLHGLSDRGILRRGSDSES